MIFQRRKNKKILRLLRKVITTLVVLPLVITFLYIPLDRLGLDSMSRLAQFQPPVRQAKAASAVTNVIILNFNQTILTGSTTNTWIVPSDWDNASNTIEVIGGGGAGRSDATMNAGGGGGGGGGYSKAVNVSLTLGASIIYQVGGAGYVLSVNGGDTYFNRGASATSTCSSSQPQTVCAKGGLSATSATGAKGGQSASGVGNSTKYSGGNGGTGNTANDGGGGGGGAASKYGQGGVGGISNATVGAGGGGGSGSTRCAGVGCSGGIGTATAGGAGGHNWAGVGGAATTTGTNGSNGTLGGGGSGALNAYSGGNGGDGIEWAYSNVGAGGGGGGGAVFGTVYGGDGGLYGGGGGGGDYGGRGAPGIILITYGTKNPTKTQWIVPSDWNNDDNLIEVIGAGGGGYSNVDNAGASGGGGGAYATTTINNLTPGNTVYYQIGTGARKTSVGLGTASTTWPVDTYFNRGSSATSTCSSQSGQAQSVCGQGGRYAAAEAVGGVGGQAANSIGIGKYNGGNGGAGNAVDTAGGGGGAAGKTIAGTASAYVGRVGGAGGGTADWGGGGGGGAGGGNSTAGSQAGSATGGTGGTGPSGTAGGGGASPSGGNGTNGSGGGGGNDAAASGYSRGGNGGDGTEWTSAGSGGGGGGGGDNTSGSTHGGNGGLYGGGGGGGSLGGFGGEGLIVVSYTPNVVHTISGTLYSAEGSGVLGSKNIKVSIATSTPGIFATTTNASGVWSVGSVWNLKQGMGVAVWVDGQTEKSFTFTKASSTRYDIINVDLYQNRVILKHEATNATSTTIADLAFCDADSGCGGSGSGDSDIQFTANGGALNVFKGQELHIWTGDSFLPGGTVTLHGTQGGSSPDGDFHLDDNASTTVNSNFNLAGSWYADSGSIFRAGTGTVTFNASTTGKTLIGAMTNSNSFYALTFNGSGGSWTFYNNASTTSALTISAGGTVAASSSAATLLTIGGSYTNNGAFTKYTSTVYFSGASPTLQGTMTNSSGFNNVEFLNGASLSNNASTSNFIIRSGTVNASGRLVTIGGNYQNNGTFTAGSTMYFTGSGKTLSGTMIGASNTFNIVEFLDSGSWTFSASASTTDFTIRSGTVTAPSSGRISVSGNYTNSNSGSFIDNSSTIYFTGSAKTLSGTMNSATTDFYNVEFISAGIKTFSANASTTNLTIRSDSGKVDFSNRLITIAGNYSNAGTIGTTTASKLYFSSNSAQSLSGTLTNSATLPDVEFLGTGIKTFSANASTSNDFTINSGASVTISSRVITIAGTYTNNNGTLTSNTGTIYFTGSGETHSGAMTNSSSLGNVVIAGGGTTIIPNASTTALTINSGSTLRAPALLSVAGNYSNSGTLDASTNSGTIFISGSSQQTLSGTMTNSSSFFNLRILNNSGTDATTSPSVIFSGAASTTASFIITAASVKVRFVANTQYTFVNINLKGGAGTPIMFRSSASGTYWKLRVTGTQSVSYVDVMDSDASSGSQITATGGTNIDSGHNLNWLFVAAGDLTWATGSADFKIYQSSNLSWGTDSLVCSGSLSDDNNSTISCSSGSVAASTQYRVEVILKNSGAAAVNMSGASEYVDFKNIKAGWAGTTPALGNCDFNDFGTNDTSAACSIAFNGNDVRLTNTGTNVLIAADTGTEGFMFLITTDSDLPSFDWAGYFNAYIDSISEDSSKIEINGPASEIPQTTIQRYRSVGVNSGDLNTGSKKVKISGNTAIFSGGMPNNMGVGDVLQYQSGGSYRLAFVHGRASATQYTVYTATGTLPIVASADTTVNVYRAYTSLSNWAYVSENGTLDDTVEDFDLGTDLVASSSVMNVAAYGDGPDTTAVEINGWTTDATHYIRIYTATSTSEVGTSQRHNGKWDDNKYYHKVTGSDNIVINNSYVKIEGLQIWGANNAGDTREISVNGAAYPGIEIGYSIIRGNGTGGTGTNYGVFLGGTSDGSDIKIYNTIFYDQKDGGFWDSFADNVSIYIYNCTFVGPNSGNGIIKYGTNTFVVKNTIVQGWSSGFAGSGYDTDSDYNVSDIADDAPGDHSRNGVTVMFADEANKDFHLASNDTGALGYGTSSPASLVAETNLNFTDDIDSEARPAYGTAWDIGADQMTARSIYRSVGPSNTSALDSGSGSKTMTISGTIATFASALPNNIGVGDVIVYKSYGAGSVDSVAFISGRTSAVQYSVQDVSGRVASSTYSNTGWQILRAYTSLSLAESGDENDGLPDNLEQFESWSNGKNLASSTEQWNIACYGDDVDTNSINIDYWNTTPSDYLRIYTPYLPTEVGASQRHQGKWDDSKYRLEPTGDVRGIMIDYVTETTPNQVRIEGIQITLGDNMWRTAIWFCKINASDADYRVSQNIIRGTPGNTASYKSGISSSGCDGNRMKAWNNIIYDINGTESAAINTDLASYSNFIYNNTIVNSTRGIVDNWRGKDYVVNNIVAYSSDSAFVNYAAYAHNNSTDASSGPGGADLGNNRTNQIFQFVDEANKDFHLASTDTGALGYGTDLSADTNLAFSVDIDGETRSGNWDIGADQMTARSIYRSVGPSNTSVLDSGSASKRMTINGTIATFASGLPNNIGVGDVIVYKSYGAGSADSVAFISGRTSAVQYSVQDVSGRVASSTYANTGWQILRAYTSLSLAESGDENDGLPDNLEQFESWSNGKNLASSTEQWNIACYGDAEDARIHPHTVIEGWTTTADNYIKIYTPYSATEVGTSQRHNGVWDSSKYHMRVYANWSDSQAILIEAGPNNESYVRIDGLQINVDADEGYGSGAIALGIYVGFGNNAGRWYVSNNIIKATNIKVDTVLGGGAGIGYIPSLMGGDAKMYVWNNIVYGFKRVSESATLFNAIDKQYRDGWMYAYSNTVYDCDRGISRSDGTNDTLVAKNNLTQGCGDGYYQVNATYSDYNLSDIADDAPGDHSRNGVTVMFADAANDDFHLASNDTGAIGYGINPFADGLVGYWNLDENPAIDNTTIVDSSGQGNNGTLDTSDAANKSVSGQIGQALSFDGTNDGVYLGTPNLLNNIIIKTVAAWINPRTFSGLDITAIVSGSNASIGWGLAMCNNNSTYCPSTANTISYVQSRDSGTGAGVWNFPASTVNFNQWQHVAVVYDRSSASNDPIFYLNGSPVSVTEVMSFGTNADDDSSVGKSIGISMVGAPFDGLLDEVRIYNRALSGAEIAELYNNNYLFTDDIDGDSRPQFSAWDIGADQMKARNIYRSVGPSNTSVLDSGSASKRMTINGTAATFASGLPNNVGVGDVIVYKSYGAGSVDSLAFISGRTSAVQYSVQDVSGHVASSTYSNTGWSIYRAYTSLAKAVDSSVGGTENTGIPSALQNFDPGPKNLASSTQVFNVAAYGDGQDTAPVTIQDWTTATSTYIRIYTATSTAEVGTSQRHNGVWDDGKYKMEVSGEDWGAAINILENYVRIDGIQIKRTLDSIHGYGISAKGEAVDSVTDIRISNSIIAGELIGSATNTAGIINYWPSGTGANIVRVWNNIIYDFKNAADSDNHGIRVFNSTFYAYNNTIYNSYDGIFAEAPPPGGSAVYAKNNLTQGCTDGFRGSYFSTDSDYNLSDIADDASGDHSRNGVTVTFVGSQDFHLSPDDINARDYGTSSPATDIYLSFSDDIDGDSRPQLSGWDIGADEALPVTYTQRGGILENDEDGSNITLPYTTAKIGERMRVRIQIDSNGNATSTLKLQYDKDSANSWQDVRKIGEIRPSLSTVIKGKMIIPTGEVANCQSGYAITTGFAYEGRGVSDQIPMPQNTCKEIAFTIETSGSSAGVNYRFRLTITSDEAIIFSYSSYPSFTTVSSNTLIYSKGNSTTTPVSTTTLPYFLDNAGYSKVLASDNNREVISNVILDTTADFAFNSPDTGGGSQIGQAVASGDFNGDGYQDFLVGNASSTMGKVFIIFGKAGWNATTTASPDVTLQSPDSGANNFGWSVASGDFNGDGYSDALVGAYGYSSNYGRAYIFYGTSTWSGTDSTADVTLDNTTGTADFFGYAVASGDFNGDGYDDALIGAYAYPAFSAYGRAYIFYGGSPMNSTVDVTLNNPEGSSEDYFGWSVASGDFNGDGYDDALIGAYAYLASSNYGRAYIFYGSANMTTPDSTADVTLDSTTGTADNFGSSVASGDFNGDGYDDALIGAHSYSSFYGRAYIFYGGSPMNSTVDVTLNNPVGTADYFGNSVSSGDFNGDGYSDALVGAYGYSNSSDYGRAYIFYGSSNMTTPDSTADVTLANPGGSIANRFGSSVASGDFNGDGNDDILAGAVYYSSQNGRAYVFYGGRRNGMGATISAADKIYEYPPQAPAYGNGYFGEGGMASGDFNGDGFLDMLVGTASSTLSQVYIFLGSKNGINPATTTPIILQSPDSGLNYFGYSVASGDFNGDGYSDALVGAYYYYGSIQGRAYIFYGRANWSGTDNTADVTLDNPNGFNNDYFGISVASGDFNSDGYADALVGAYQYTDGVNYRGRAYIFYGGSSMNSTVDVIFNNPNGYAIDNFGISVASGDFNGDGYSDALVGALVYGVPDAGRAYIFYGASNMEAASPDSSADVTLENPGGLYNERFGSSVASGDFNGDGYADALIGAGNYLNGSFYGRAYIFYGGSSMNSTVDVTLANPNGSNADFFGSSVASGDFNGDGYDDALVGAYAYPAFSFKGRAYIFYGNATLSATISSANVTLENPTGIADLFGVRVASGDFNSDGYADALVGASYYDKGSYTDAGRVYLYNGAKSDLYPVFNFSAKSDSSSKNIEINWEGQSSRACNATWGKQVYLQIYNFISPVGWQTLTSSSACSTSTDFSLLNTVETNLSYYYDSNYWVYVRAYQDYDSEIFATDYLNINFAAVGGTSLALANHPVGQESNKFEISGNSITNGELFNFELQASGTVSVTNLIISLSDIRGFSTANISVPKIYVDLNDDGNIDGGETTTVGGTGAVSISGSSGTITFSSQFTVSGSKNYILRADTVSIIDPGDQMTFRLWAYDITSNSSTAVSGFVPPAIHIKTSGTSGGAPIGGNVTVYSPIGGGTIPGGQEIGGEFGFLAPTAHSGSWTSGENAYISDDNYATINSAVTHNYTSFSFSITGNQIDGFEVKLEVSASVQAGGTIQVDLWCQSCSSWSSAKSTASLTMSDTVSRLGSPSDKWGKTWNISTDFSNANFTLRVTAQPSSNTVRIDAIQVKVYNSSTGGTPGGGGEL